MPKMAETADTNFSSPFSFSLGYNQVRVQKSIKSVYWSDPARDRRG